MKSLSVLLVLAALGLSACGNSSNASPGAPESAPEEQKVYVCPMHCVPEGQTTEYTSTGPGRCPVCNMELQERR